MIKQTLNEIRELAGMPPLTEGARVEGKFKPEKQIGVLWDQTDGDKLPKFKEIGWTNFGRVEAFLDDEQLKQAGKLPTENYAGGLGESVGWCVVYGDKNLSVEQVKSLLLAKLEKCIAKKKKFYDVTYG